MVRDRSRNEAIAWKLIIGQSTRTTCDAHNAKSATALETPVGWQEYASGFLIGGIGGAAFAYFVLLSISVLQELL